MLTGLSLSLASSNWFSIWLGIEITLIGLIKVGTQAEGMIIYFIVQVVTSSLFLILSLYSSTLIIMPILIKLGASPIHYWLVHVTNNLSWITFALVMTIQKVVPLNIRISVLNKYVALIIVISALFGSIGGFNQTNMKHLLVYSSIANLPWILTFYGNQYLIIYSIGLIIVIILLNSSNIQGGLPVNIILFFNILSLGGFPPFTGFFPKIMVLKCIGINIGILLIITSVINLFLYLRMANLHIVGVSTFTSILLINPKIKYITILWPIIGVCFIY